MNEHRKQELAALVDAEFDGLADQASRTRLQELLCGDPAAQAWFVECCQLRAMLTWEHGGLPPVEFGDLRIPSVRVEESPSLRRSAQRRQVLTVAASLLFLATAGWLVYEFMAKTGSPAARTAADHCSSGSRAARGRRLADDQQSRVGRNRRSGDTRRVRFQLDADAQVGVAARPT